MIEIAAVYAHMAELCTRWDAKHPDLEGLIERGLELVGDERSRERVLLLAAKAFLPRRMPRAGDADWEASLRTAQEALAIAEDLGGLREVSLCLDAVGYAYRELGDWREAYQRNKRRLPIAQSLQDDDELIDAHTMVAISALMLGDVDECIAHARTAQELALSTEKTRLGLNALQTEAIAHLYRGEFADALAAAARVDQFPAPRGRASVVVVGMAASAALGSPDEQAYRDRLVELEATPFELAAADFTAAVYGQRESEGAFHALRSAGYPKTRVDRVLIGILVVLAAARWGIEDDANDALIAAEVERAGYARGRAMLTQAQGLRALRAGEHARAERLLFDAAQAFATLRLEYDLAVALADHARALESIGRSADAAGEHEEARRLAERLGATALTSALDAQPLGAGT